MDALQNISIVVLDIEGTVCPISFVKEVLSLSPYPAHRTHHHGVGFSPHLRVHLTRNKERVRFSPPQSQHLQSVSTEHWASPARVIPIKSTSKPFASLVRLCRCKYKCKRAAGWPKESLGVCPQGSAEPAQVLRYVKADCKFPYALQVLPSTLATQWDSPTFSPYRDAFPAEHRSSPEALLSHVKDLMAQDLKIPYLKSLQGYLWLHGYQSGSLRCPLFPDVHPAMVAWHDAGIPIIIYSSGSVPAQKLLFQYTDSPPDPDLRPLISDYFDTVNAGMKQEKKQL
ncbi:hypothetical protein G7Y89_g4908 [Cudoniella acicularis]|uniref:Enolase-phosphatase E1 n=1 Tax=Cudoniella acicularis TaxID=354080 RepID=A0A8H4RNI0_9HELO|nr:hypothetical protein G7Y89_g4908 [Cudoniella acicularis]